MVLVPCARFFLHKPEKKQKKYHDSYSYCTCSYSSKNINGKNKIQPFGTAFLNLSDNIAVLRGHENCCRLATHTVVSAPKSPPQGGAIWDRWWGWSFGRIAAYRTWKIQRYIEMLPGVDYSKNRLFFCARCNTGHKEGEKERKEARQKERKSYEYSRRR